MASEARSRPGPAGYGRALENYLRKYVVQPRYRPEQMVSLLTTDGVRLGGARLDGPDDAFATFVLVHGFSHSSRTPGIYDFAHHLARSAHVVVPELRGHGRSGGRCALGAEEPLDVDAAVRFASTVHPDLPVVTVGISLGGAAVFLHAGTHGGVAAVVGVSAPAWWGAWDTPATRRIERYATTRAGRTFVSCFMRTRIADHCAGVPDARDVVKSITPALTLIVHDPEDHYFGRDHPEAVYAWAEEPKALWWEERAGHGTDLLSPDLADRLVAELRERGVARPARDR